MPRIADEIRLSRRSAGQERSLSCLMAACDGGAYAKAYGEAVVRQVLVQGVSRARSCLRSFIYDSEAGIMKCSLSGTLKRSPVPAAAAAVFASPEPASFCISRCGSFINAPHEPVFSALLLMSFFLMYFGRQGSLLSA